MATSDKFIPGSDADSVEIFVYPFFNEEESKDFVKKHGKVMFIIRGPPGTGKWSLTNLIMSHFPSGVRCSANDYFTDTFNLPVRTKESLKESHHYCHRRVKQECIKNTHPIIVSNTHMKKNEMQEYLNFAAEYEYTVIITSTLDKFKVSPKILAKSNTKGLDENYFRKRLKAWQDVYPNLMGWFLCPDDSLYILQQLQSALDSLLGDGRFCRVFNAFDLDTLLNSFKAKTMLCCVAGFMKYSPFELKNYYISEKVRNSYGKCFTVSILAFVVTKSDIFAVVQLDRHLKELTFKLIDSDSEIDDDDINRITTNMQSTSITSFYNFKLVSLNNDFSRKPKSALLSENHADHINVNEISFIHLAQSKEKQFPLRELNNIFRKLFHGNVDQSGKINNDQFSEFETGYAACRLHNDGWLVKLPKILLIKTIFTGLYI